MDVGHPSAVARWRNAHWCAELGRPSIWNYDVEATLADRRMELEEMEGGIEEEEWPRLTAPSGDA